MRSRHCFRSLTVCLVLGAGLTSLAPANAQVSARELFEGEMQAAGRDSSRWSQWQYRTSELSAAAGLDFNLAWGYVDADAAAEGDVFISVLRNHSPHAYCIRPKLSFKGKLLQVDKVAGSVLVPPRSSLRAAFVRPERRTEVVHEINAAFWPAPPGSGPDICALSEPAGLAEWLQQPGQAAFRGNRVAPPRAGD